MAGLVIRNADWIVTVDRERRILRNGAIVIMDDRISFVGKDDHLPEACADEACADMATIDAAGLLVLPGFVDTHVHNTQHLGRGLADECDIPKQLLERLYGYESEMTSEDAYWAARACQLELIKAGTTCFLDPSSYYPGETAKATGESGMRGIVSRTAFDVHNTTIGKMPSKTMFRETLSEALEHAEETVLAHNNTHGGRVRAWFALRILAGCSDDLCRGIRRLANKHNAPIVMHASESRDEIVASRLSSGFSDVERLEHLGVLGPDMVMIHMGWASPKEIFLAQKHGFKISYTPSTGFRLGMGDTGFGHFPEMAAIGVTVSLSCNSAMSSNYLDMVRLMNLGAGAMRATRLSAFIFPPEEMIEMATINGAVAVGAEKELGSIEVGKKADLALFDTRGPEWRPLLNPLSNLVHSARGGAHTVIVDGKVLMANAKVRTIDEAETLAECQRRGVLIARKSGLDRVTQSPWPRY
jgi:5-methylthioadenosine/S-adenosylhomocysteine deaminase